MSPYLLFVAALAIWEIIEIWHHGSLFAGWRARTEVWHSWLGELLGCPFCLAPWVALPVVTVLFLWDHGMVDQRWLLPDVLFIFAFAAARSANVLNDALHRFARTPRSGIPKTITPGDQALLDGIDAHITKTRWASMRTDESRAVEKKLREVFPQSDAYRYNSASIRVRVIDQRFEGLSREDRDAKVEPLLDQLPVETQNDIITLLTLTPGEARESLRTLEFEIAAS